MRVTALIPFLILSAIAFPRDGHAEKVKANQETKLFARPGERAKVIAVVANGKAMTVLGKDGRWLKVRVAGRTGYVAQSTVDLPDNEEIARNTRRRSFVDGRGTKRGFGGQEGPDDRIGADAVGENQGSGDDEGDDEDDKPAKPTKSDPIAKGGKGGKVVAVKAPVEDDDDEDDDEDEDSRKRVRVRSKATVYNDPDAKSEAILVATRDTLLFPTGEKKGAWTEVENDEGDLGYVMTKELESGEPSKPPPDRVASRNNGGSVKTRNQPAVGGGRGGSQIDVRARAGVSFVTQALRSPGGRTTVPDNYNIATAAATLALGGGYYRPYGKSLVIGIEGTYDYATALPGIKVPMGKTTSISMHNINLRGVVGLDLKRPSGMMLLGRLGYLYHSFQVANVTQVAENTALLPSEIIQSPMIGVALAMPRLGQKIGLRFSVDAIPLNLSYTQTKNLEDGASPAMKGVIAGVGLTYRWRPSMDISAAYDLTYSSASFGDKATNSMRHAMGGVTRVDLFHAVTAGIVKAF